MPAEFSSPFPIRCPLAHSLEVRGLTTGPYDSGDFTIFNVAHPELFSFLTFDSAAGALTLAKLLTNDFADQKLQARFRARITTAAEYCEDCNDATHDIEFTFIPDCS